MTLLAMASHAAAFSFSVRSTGASSSTLEGDVREDGRGGGFPRRGLPTASSLAMVCSNYLTARFKRSGCRTARSVGCRPAVNKKSRSARHIPQCVGHRPSRLQKDGFRLWSVSTRDQSRAR